jgi:hypothetical protein
MFLLEKQPNEKFYTGINFSNVLGENETISSVAVSAKNSNGETVSIIEDNSSSINDTSVQARVYSGTDRNDYYIKFNIITSLGNNFEDDIRLKVREEGF